VGATYSDLGATITGPQADLNLGITTYVNGALMDPDRRWAKPVAHSCWGYQAGDPGCS
jgi:hypothetical protein